MQIKEHTILLILITLLTSCSNNKNRGFDNWKGFKVGQLQGTPVENYTEKEIAKLEYREVNFNKLKPLLEKFEEIDSTKISIWFDNMLGVVSLNNGDSLKLNLGFPAALFRDVKSRKVYTLHNQYYARQWKRLVFENLILN